jgi:hypothetical protein
MPLPRVFEQFAHVIHSARDHNHFGEKTIRAGISGEANKVDGPAEHAVWAKQRYKIIAQPAWCALCQTIWRAIALWRAGRQPNGLDIG